MSRNDYQDKVVQLNKKLLVGLVSALACLGMGTALAGAKDSANVGRVSVLKSANGTGMASGRLGHIYNGTGRREFLTCTRGNGLSVCRARSEAGLEGACITTSAWLAKALDSVSPDASVSFTWNAAGRCTNIQVVHSSTFAAKQN